MAAGGASLLLPFPPRSPRCSKRNKTKRNETKRNETPRAGEANPDLLKAIGIGEAPEEAAEAPEPRPEVAKAAPPKRAAPSTAPVPSGREGRPPLKSAFGKHGPVPAAGSGDEKLAWDDVDDEDFD